MAEIIIPLGVEQINGHFMLLLRVKKTIFD